MKEFEHGVIASAEQVTPNAKKIVSPELSKDISLQQIGLEVDVNIDSEQLKVYEAEILGLITQMEQGKENPYHNLKHAQEVLSRVRELIVVSDLAPEDSAIIEVAALFHDIGHSGTTIRGTEYGFSNEEFAAMQADKFGKEKGLSVYQRLILQGLIIGTTFGNPEIEPKTDMEKMLAMADLGGFNKSWDNWVIESAQVLKEAPKEKRPANIGAWLKGRQWFLGQFIRPRLTPEAQKAWGDQLTEKETIVAKLIADSTSTEMEIVNQEILPLL